MKISEIKSVLFKRPLLALKLILPGYWCFVVYKTLNPPTNFPRGFINWVFFLISNCFSHFEPNILIFGERKKISWYPLNPLGNYYTVSINPLEKHYFFSTQEGLENALELLWRLRGALLVFPSSDKTIPEEGDTKMVHWNIWKLGII